MNGLFGFGMTAPLFHPLNRDEYLVHAFMTPDRISVCEEDDVGSHGFDCIKYSDPISDASRMVRHNDRATFLWNMFYPFNRNAHV